MVFPAEEPSFIGVGRMLVAAVNTVVSSYFWEEQYKSTGKASDSCWWWVSRPDCHMPSGGGGEGGSTPPSMTRLPPHTFLSTVSLQVGGVGCWNLVANKWKPSYWHFQNGSGTIESFGCIFHVFKFFPARSWIQNWFLPLSSVFWCVHDFNAL